MTIAAIFLTIGVGIACALLGAWVGFRLGRAAKALDDRDALIRDIAEKYHAMGQDNPERLVAAGVCRLHSNAEIEKSISLIREFGYPDPLRGLRDQLSDKDIPDFFWILRDDPNPKGSKDLKKAATEAKLT